MKGFMVALKSVIDSQMLCYLTYFVKQNSSSGRLVNKQYK